MTIQISHLPDLITISDSIELRAKTAESFAAFEKVAFENREHLRDWMPWAENIPDESSIEHYATAEQKKIDNEAANWDIYIDNKMSGAIGTLTRDKDSTALEIGYWLDKDATGNGVITNCSKILVDVIFKETDVPAIEIACDKTNLKSAAVAIRCGFTLDREVDRTNSKNKARCDSDTGQFYQLTREQWNANRA